MTNLIDDHVIKRMCINVRNKPELLKELHDLVEKEMRIEND